VRVRDGEVTIRPIAGTRPRGKPRRRKTSANEASLLADPKERAEHLMLLDLGRNDVGRVAEEIGSVKVTDSYTIERYSHVMHIVSNVEGRLDTASTTPSMRCSRVSRPAPSAARPRCAPARSSPSWSRKRAAPMRAASAISRPMARWTAASCCARRWSRTA
jgi:anthranilate/para-aminobenzoate synthase component I